MIVLRTDCDLDPEKIEYLRKQVEDRMGEDCVILTNGLTIERFPCAKDGAVPKQETAPAD